MDPNTLTKARTLSCLIVAPVLLLGRFWKAHHVILFTPIFFEKVHHAFYSHHYFLKKNIMPYIRTTFYGIGTACQKFCFIFPPVFLKKVHHAKPIRIGFLWMSTPCLLFPPCFFKVEHSFLYSHHFKGIKYNSITIRTSTCIKQSRVCEKRGVQKPELSELSVFYMWAAWRPNIINIACYPLEYKKDQTSHK